ncbi:MAG: pyridoxine 5'-phosphate synthase [Paramuribaculum sp.]|nr:pyridoxine 5'-phosphate synthase [Paramuribaculum sp.]
MTNLSVNINKVATIRNARGENVPDVQKFAIDCEEFGANGITVHPRPDERHITRKDVFLLRPLVKTEFNIEGFPSPEFLDLVFKTKPEQVTLVPDLPAQITSNSGWDVDTNLQFLTEIVERLRDAGIRTSIFVDPEPEIIKKAAATGADRVELYTKPYAALYPTNPEKAVKPYVEASIAAHKCGLGVNAGHDLNLTNLHFFYLNMPYLNEVSIGHALISDALYLGLKETIRLYKECLRPGLQSEAQ